MGVWYKINRWLQQRAMSGYRPRAYRVPDPALYEAIKSAGEGVYGMHLVSANNNWVARIISLFSRGYSHSVLFIYMENLMEFMSPEFKKAARVSWDFYYGGLVEFDPQILVLASADEYGLICHELSQYQMRKFVVTTVTRSLPKMAMILKYLERRLLVGEQIRPYDATGLALWLFKFGDDPNSDYCSEVYFTAAASAGIKVAETREPSPYDLVEYAEKNGAVLFRK